MNIATFSYTELVLWLRAQCPSFQRRIGGTAEFMAQTTPDAQFPVPYAFCMPLAQQGDETNIANATQDRHEIVAIIVALDNVEQGGVAQGRAAVARIDAVGTLQTEIEKAIYLWLPATFHLMQPPRFQQRVPMGMTNTRLWFQLEFEFPYQVHCNYFQPREVADWAETADLPQNHASNRILKIASHYNVTEEEVRSLDDGFFAEPHASQSTDAGDEARAAQEAESRVVAPGCCCNEGDYDLVSDGGLNANDDPDFHGSEIIVETDGVELTSEELPVAPNAVSGITPADDATDVPVSGTTVEWSPAKYATGYVVRFGTVNPPPIVVEATSKRYYNPGVLSGETEYFVAIDSVNAQGTTFGAVQSFTTEAILSPPGQVGLVYPLDGATGIAITDDIRWSAANLASSYVVRFGTVNPPPIVASGVTALSYDPGALLNNTTYYRRIDSVNGAGTVDGVVGVFTTVSGLPSQVAILSPANGETGVNCIGAVASWGAADDASGYDVYLDTTNGSTLVSSNQSGLTYALPSLVGGTTYYLRVDSRNALGVTAGTVQTFVAWNITALAAIIAARYERASGVLSSTSPRTLASVGQDVVRWEDVSGAGRHIDTLGSSPVARANDVNFEGGDGLRWAAGTTPWQVAYVVATWEGAATFPALNGLVVNNAYCGLFGSTGTTRVAASASAFVGTSMDSTFLPASDNAKVAIGFIATPYNGQIIVGMRASAGWFGGMKEIVVLASAPTEEQHSLIVNYLRARYATS